MTTDEWLKFVRVGLFPVTPAGTFGHVGRGVVIVSLSVLAVAAAPASAAPVAEVTSREHVEGYSTFNAPAGDHVDTTQVYFTPEVGDRYLLGVSISQERCDPATGGLTIRQYFGYVEVPRPAVTPTADSARVSEIVELKGSEWTGPTCSDTSGGVRTATGTWPAHVEIDWTAAERREFPRVVQWPPQPGSCMRGYAVAAHGRYATAAGKVVTDAPLFAPAIAGPTSNAVLRYGRSVSARAGDC